MIALQLEKFRKIVFVSTSNYAHALLTPEMANSTNQLRFGLDFFRFHYISVHCGGKIREFGGFIEIAEINPHSVCLARIIREG